MHSVLIERICGRVYATHEDSDRRIELQGTDDQIHTSLCISGYKRVGAAFNDKLAGQYVCKDNGEHKAC